MIHVADDGTVRVTIPRWGSKKDAAAFAEHERAWIAKQRRRIEQERARRSARPEAVDSSLASIPSPGEHDAWRKRAKQELPARLLELAARHGVPVARVSVRNQRWRWGSCSARGHICLNWRLLKMPDWVRDYVLIHELMHVKRMDHSPKFWKLVAQACPAYQSARAWLRAHAKHDR